MQASFLWRALAVSVLVWGLAACGDTSEVGNLATTPTTTPTPVAGTVATGAPLANANVSLLCNAGGTPVTATTNAAGKYTGTLPVGCAGPYIFKATGVESTVTPTAAITLYGFADSRNNINITPITDIAARIVTTGDPAAAYAAVAGGSKKVADYWNAAAGADARAKLTSLMAQMNISIAGLADLLHQPFNASAGDALDNVLEAIKLQRGSVSLAALAELVAQYGGTVKDKPWSALFPVGVNTLVLNATDCTSGGYDYINSVSLPVVTVTSARFTITRGATTISLSMTANTINGVQTFPSIVVADASSSVSRFILSTNYGTRTFASPYFSADVGTGNARAYFSTNQYTNPIILEQTFDYSAYDTTLQQDKTLQCAKVTNPLELKSLSNFQPQARLSNLISGTPTETVTSAISAPTGCTVFSNAVTTTYSYVVSPLGDIKINNTSVPPDWLSSGAFPQAFFNEATSFEGVNRSGYEIRLEIRPDTGVIVRRNNLIFNPQVFFPPTFSHSCSFNNS